MCAARAFELWPANGIVAMMKDVIWSTASLRCPPYLLRFHVSGYSSPMILYRPSTNGLQDGEVRNQQRKGMSQSRRDRQSNGGVIVYDRCTLVHASDHQYVLQHGTTRQPHKATCKDTPAHCAPRRSWWSSTLQCRRPASTVKLSTTRTHLHVRSCAPKHYFSVWSFLTLLLARLRRYVAHLVLSVTLHATCPASGSCP
jgi:hypothetical protein